MTSAGSRPGDTSRRFPTRPAPGRHCDAIGTNSSRGPKYTKLSAQSASRCTATNTIDSVPRNLCRSRHHAGTPLRRMRRVDTARPHRMLAVTTAHAMSPEDARRVPRQLRVHERPGSSTRRRPRSSARPRGTATRARSQRSREREARVDAGDHDRLRDALGPPRVGCDCNDRDDRRARRVTRARIDDVVVLPIAARPRADPARARHERLVARADGRRRHAVVVERMLHRHRPRAVRQLPRAARMSPPRLTSALRAPRSTSPRDTKSAARPLPSPPRSTRTPGGHANPARVDVDLDAIEAGNLGRDGVPRTRDRRARPLRTSGRNRRARARRGSSGRTDRRWRGAGRTRT